MEECDTVTDKAKKVTVLDAIVNLCLSWNKVQSDNIKNRVQSDSIKKCIYNCGFPNLDDVAQAETQPEDYTELFQDILEVPWQEFVNVDENIATEPDGQCSEVPTDLPETASSSVKNMDH